MIAKALSEEADIFLMDEPSAYLDVEQRLQVSKGSMDLDISFSLEKGKWQRLYDGSRVCTEDNP